MNEEMTKGLSTDPYKGVRDFYPEDMFLLKYIFSIMRKSVEQFGYQEYGASILEPTELYKAKSGEEIVNDQTYSFKDRGDREVTLRPEMTPTVTRMVAGRRRELSFPLRWYSIPNLFRYEKPQRGRLREHYQLNVDLFGVSGIGAEVEVISVASTIMRNFGADDSTYQIKINSRKVLNYMLENIFSLAPKESYSAMKLIDRKNKMTIAEFNSQAQEIFKDRTNLFIDLISATTIEDFINIAATEDSSEILGTKDLTELMDRLHAVGIKNAIFDPTLARGFDYYTGIVFEVFDLSPENPRALFGGGRFDDLLSVFGSDKVPAVGFGMGDVTIRDFLETYGLLPAYTSHISIMLCSAGGNESTAMFTDQLAQNLRNLGLNIAIDISGRKLGQQIEGATKQTIPYIIVIGENEVKDKKYKLRELETGTETEFNSEKDVAEFIHSKKI